MGNKEKAIEYFTKALLVHKHDATYKELFSILIESNQIEQALDMLHQALEYGLKSTE